VKKLKLLAGAVLAIGAVALVIHQFRPSSAGRTPAFEWQCSKCQHQFRSPVSTAAEDKPVIECPKCKAPAAERITHFQCRKCWHKYDLRGTNTTRNNIICPACGGRSARDLDNPIPGDDTPVDGGKPYPGN
jgi:putative FmdB family regulatory protein